MSNQRSTVYIPLVEQSHQNSQLLEVYAENTLSFDKKADEKNWSPVVASLRYASLYGEGLHVVNAIRKLDLKPSRWAIYQSVKNYAWLDKQRLYVGNNRFENCEGSSAQLGLAIALLLNASESPIRYAIATGGLSTEKYADYDVAIAEVGSVPEKLDLIIEKRQAKALPDVAMVCFTPRYYKKDGERYEVADLPQVKALAALNINVKPIEWLSAATNALKADKTRLLKQDKLINLTAGVVLGLLASFAVVKSWLDYPIPLQLLPGKHLAEPFMVCTNRDTSEVSYSDLERDGTASLLPLFSEKNTEYNIGLGWILQPTKTLPFSDRYYVAFIHLGEHTGYKIFSATETGNITVAANEQLKWYWQMEEPAFEQDNVLLIVLNRTPIAADQIEQVLAKQFPDAKTNLDVLQARNFLLPLFPGHYDFRYKSIIRDTPCLKS